MNGSTNGSFRLRLYVAGQTPKSISALSNLKRLCAERLGGRYRIEVVDLLSHPARARRDDIVVVPTVVRRLPPPLRRIIGDLSNHERVLVGLDLRPRDRTERNRSPSRPARRRSP